MTKNITLEEVPPLIKDEMIKDVSDLLSERHSMNGLCLQYQDGYDNQVYLLYFIKNAAGKIEECLFKSNDIILDFRKPVKSLNALEF